MAAVTGGSATAGRGDNPRSPEQLEAEALADVRGIERTLQARAEAAFPDKNDPLRIYGEGVAAAGVAHVRAMAKATAAAASRIEGLLTGARRTAEAQTQAATAKAEADRAAAKLEAVEAVRAGLGEVLASDRKARLGWAIGAAGLGAVLLLAAGGAVGWFARGARDATATADKLAELRAEADATKATLTAATQAQREAADGMQRAVSDAGAGLSVLRTLGNLPDAERMALNGVIDAVAAGVNGTKPNPQLAAVRELMALPAPARAQAAEFAKIGDARFRAEFLPVIRLAEGRARDPWWAGEQVYPGCLTNGPGLAARGGGRVATCLVQLPDAWLSATDVYLRQRHYNLR